MANLFDVPEDIAAAGWSKLNALVDDNDIEAPDGFTTADKLKDNNGGGTGSVRVQDTVGGLTSSVAHICSGFIKKAGLNSGLLSLDALGVTANMAVNADTGTIISVGASVTDSGIEDYGNEWWRAWFTFTATTDISGLCRLYPANDDGLTTVDLDDTSSIYWWGIMLEPGTTLNPYISDNAITVTPQTGAYSFTRSSTKEFTRSLTKDLTRNLASQ